MGNPIHFPILCDRCRVCNGRIFQHGKLFEFRKKFLSPCIPNFDMCKIEKNLRPKSGPPPLPFKGVLRSFFILDILNLLISESTLLFTRTKTEQIWLRYPHPQVTSPKNSFGGIRRWVAKPFQCLFLLRHKLLTNLTNVLQYNTKHDTNTDVNDYTQ